MAEALVFSKSAIFVLAVLTFLEILFAHGRPIKLMNKQGNDNTISLHQSHIPDTAFSDSAASKDDYRPTSPGFSPGVGHPKEVAEFEDDHKSKKPVDHRPDDVGNPASGKTKSSETTPSSHIPQSAAGSFNPSALNDFRPTDPGNSPGVGHPSSLKDSDEEIETSANGYVDDHRPTQPGHSPGVGHAYEKNEKPNP